MLQPGPELARQAPGISGAPPPARSLEHWMEGPTFNSVEEAASYLADGEFELPRNIQMFEGKRVLVLLMLSEA